MKKGEIYLVNFDPSFGAEFQKIRPALIIQSEKVQSNLVSIMPISSKIDKKEQSDLLLKKDKINRLFCDSVVKVKQISSFDKRRFIHFVGKISTKETQEVDDYLKKHFALR